MKIIYTIILIVNAKKKRSNSIPFIRRELDKVRTNIKYTMNNTLECLGEYVSNLSRELPVILFLNFSDKAIGHDNKGGTAD